MADKPKLTRAERKQIEAVIRKYRGDGKPHTAQDTIPYQIMYPDGICYLGNRHYSQSIEFFDINYLLAQPDDQTAIFEYLCDLYNYLDSSIHVQFTYPNRKSDREQLARSFEMPPCNDGLDPIRQEQTDILKRQLARGNNGSVKTKYITYTIEADNLKAARARLSRISLDIQGYFKIMGAVSRVLDGKERLEVLHGIMHPDMSVLGNKPELFGDSEYIPKYITNRPEGYEIPPSAMEDETFAAVITEAEKYLGYPYVWGGSSPSTSFDCSGFVSWVLTNSGVCNTGRLGAQGLYNISTPVSNPQPGDLVFFVGTYDTPGVSHVGIYVGNSMMIHCGDPISYSNLNSSYWQAHFYAYARPPYN